jgi:beta-carotene hydroxylase
MEIAMSHTMTDQELTKIAQTYMGRKAWFTLALAFGSITLYFAFFAAAIGGALPLWLCALVVSYLVYVVYTPLHEAVHNNIAGDSAALKKVNDVVGHIVGSILGVPFAVHHPAHMAHHRSTNVPGKDPDLVFKGTGVWDVLSGGPKIVINEYRYYFRYVYPRASRSSRFIVWSEIAFALGWRAGIAFAGYPLEAFVLGVCSSVVGISFLGVVFAWIVHVPFEKTKRFENTATIFMPKWFHRVGTWAWLWQNYHSIHHLFPRIPFYKYRIVHDSIYEGMTQRGAPTIGKPVVPSAICSEALPASS